MNFGPGLGLVVGWSKIGVGLLEDFGWGKDQNSDFDSDWALFVVGDFLAFDSLRLVGLRVGSFARTGHNYWPGWGCCLNNLRRDCLGLVG